MTVPASRADTLTKLSLKPGQKIEGSLWFPTPPGKAKASKLELKLGAQSIVLSP